jgi:hypothetical protein
MMLSVGGAESMMLSDTLSACAESAESIILSALSAESMILSALFGCVITLTAVATKNNNRRYWLLPIYNYRQQRLNSCADWSAAKDA